MNGGDLIASVLAAQQTPFLFTLCGGHISPILVAAKARGIRIIDTRHEATAVFAADAVARLTGRPGVAAVTAGPGVTNSITALKNAQMAQSPLILIGGAAPTALQGRGALQDIEQLKLVGTLVKWAVRIKKVAELVPAMEKAFRIAQEGTPGPVFVECPVDLLYEEGTVKQWYGMDRGGKSLTDKLLKTYLKWHVNRMFSHAWDRQAGPEIRISPTAPSDSSISKVVSALEKAQRPVMIAGSQLALQAAEAPAVAEAIQRLGIPTYLSGMARGLLGRDSDCQYRHKRREALREADLVLLAGLPCDFRLDYGNHIRRSATYVSVNIDRHDLYHNRRPQVAVQADPGFFLRRLADAVTGKVSKPEWEQKLQANEKNRQAEIDEKKQEVGDHINPLHLLSEIDGLIGPDSLIVADGGDFVGTASYILRPPSPLSWLDPGAFGTLGVGAGFALGAKLVRPDKTVWLILGDGAAGYSMTEFDTFARHGLPVIAVVGNDGAWSQIAREQVDMLGDDVGTVLGHTAYDRVAAGFGSTGFLLDNPDKMTATLQAAQAAAANGQAVLINAILNKSDFRKGSISM
ncbi:MAG: thiamine pyrophosphate-binding protein [Saprospiraceae bacterium]|nr:thiamine pyrophosphate-binding protein [Saprospiraceae bacterium]